MIPEQNVQNVGEKAPEIIIPDSPLAGPSTHVDDSQEKVHLSGPALFLIMSGIAFAVFLIALDTAIVATAIPFITERFHSTKDIGWYGSAYLLTLCSLQPVSGRLYMYFSLRSTFLGFFALFEFGSLLCATAVSSNMFIVGRAAAGAGGAGIISGAFSIVAFVIPLVKRPLYIGALSSVFGVATVVGPVLGGSFTQHASWRWCFYFSLPVGGVSAITLILLFHPPTRGLENQPILERLRKIDLIGAALFIPTITMILLALQWGGSTYPWRSATIIGLFLGFGGLLTVFTVWQIYKGDEAMIPMSLLFQRTVIFSSLTIMFALGGIFVVVYYLPEWFQVVQGASPIHSGVMNIPMFLSQIVGTLISGGMVTKLGYLNPWIFFGCSVMAVGTGLLSTMDLSTGHAKWISYQVLQGFGFGVMAQMPIVAIQTTLPPSQNPVGISIATFAQFFGGSLFVALAQTIFSNVLLHSLAAYAPSVDAPALLLAGSGAVRDGVTPDQLPGVLHAFNEAITSTFYLSAGTSVAAFLCSLGMERTNVKGKNLMVAPGEEQA